MKPNALFAIVLAGCLAAASPGRAGLLLSETFTGAQLLTDPRATFARTPVLQGTSLFFDTGTLPIEKLINLQLFPAGALNPADPVIVRLIVNLTVQRSAWPTAPEDHDPGIGVGDGTIFGGAMMGDNFNGDGSARLYHDTGTAGTGFVFADELFTGTGYPGIGGSLTFSSRITLTSASTDVQVTYGSTSASHFFAEPFADPFDLSAPLSFVFFAHDAEERYKLNTLSIEVEGTLAAAVPEPASLALFALGAMGLIAAKIRRRRPAGER